jgi:hypothetical protein
MEFRGNISRSHQGMTDEISLGFCIDAKCADLASRRDKYLRRSSGVTAVSTSVPKLA